MAYRVSIDELGVANDNTVIEGETPGDVWRRVQQHLKDKHKIKIPDLEDLGGEGILFPGMARFDNNAVAAGQQAPIAVGVGRFDTDENAESGMIVTRLVEKLHVGEQGSGTSDIVPPGGTQSPMA
jgi:hypothetical protein